MLNETRAKKRKRLSIEGWLLACTLLLGTWTVLALLIIPERIAFLAGIDPAYNPTYYALRLLYVLDAVVVFALGTATVVGILRGDRRFRWYYVGMLVFMLIPVLVQIMMYGYDPSDDSFVVTVFWGGLMLLYFFKSYRVQATFFPEVKAENTAEDA
ncbi:MAG: DUF2569 family protein [Oscillospiraceae bacterium]|jgi:hypothetical protein|nr:DUF2569 family protein [Oscillospiraceae bacterium]